MFRYRPTPAQPPAADDAHGCRAARPFDAPNLAAGNGGQAR